MQVTSDTLISVMPDYRMSYPIRLLFLLRHKNVKLSKFIIMLAYKLVPFKISKFTTVYFATQVFETLTLNLPTTIIVAQPFNIIKWQLKFNPVA